MDAYLAARREKCGETVICSERHYLRAMMSRAYECGFIRKLPVISIKVKKNKPRAVHLTPAELTRLFTAIRYSPIYGEALVCVSTGMRIGEVLAMEWQWIDLERGEISIPASATKTKHGRVVSITTELREFLLNLQHREGRVFSRGHCGVLHHWSKVRKAAGVTTVDGDALHVHDLRHIAAQCLLDGGADMVDVMHFLGHRNISTTQRVYAPFSRRDMLDKCRGIMEGYTGQSVVNEDLQ